MGEPLPNYLYAIPGKMTESPYLAKTITEAVAERLTPNKKVYGVVFDSATQNKQQQETPVTLRPCDEYKVY
jgi:hypothetical protein